MAKERIEPKPGQESVWDYPRPPALQPYRGRIRVEVEQQTIADTTGAFRVLETSHPPTYYLPPEDVATKWLRENPSRSFCEWKGRACYFDIVLPERTIRAACWSYPQPSARFREIAGYLCFYPSKVDACWVDQEQATAQEGDFYGGWVTSNIVGPFKGGPGTMGW